MIDRDPPGEAPTDAPDVEEWHDRKAAEPSDKRKTARRRRGRRACILGLAVAALGLVGGRLADLWIGFDIFAQFTLHFGLAAFAFAAGALMPRARVLTALVLIMLGILGIGLWPHWMSENTQAISEARPGEKHLRLMSYNSWFENRELDAVTAEIERLDPDIAALVEFDPGKKPILARLKSRYPYQFDCLREDYCNIVILSKFPFVNTEAKVGWEGPPLARASFGPELGNLTLVAVHTIRFPHQRAQYKQITELATLLLDYTGNRVVMGDFNATPFSRIVRTLEERTGLHRLTSLPSWPARILLPQLAIDHIFVSTRMRTLTPQRIGRSEGSDHFPIIVDVAVPLT